jgi:hypothetical protein
VSSFYTKESRSHPQAETEERRLTTVVRLPSCSQIPVPFGFAKIANRAIEGAEARFRAFGIDPEDPSSEDEDPRYRLS